MKKLHQEKELVFFCDLHGHSRAHGAFVYGCKSNEAPESTRVYPYLLSKINPNFSYGSSKFGIQRSKARTARISLFKEFLHVPAIYTLETSFADTLDGSWFTPNLLKSMGRDIVRALIPYCELSIPFNIKSNSRRIVYTKRRS